MPTELFKDTLKLQPNGYLWVHPGSARQAALFHGQLVSARVDRLAQANDGEVGQLLGDDAQAPRDLLELAGHGGNVP